MNRNKRKLKLEGGNILKKLDLTVFQILKVIFYFIFFLLSLSFQFTKQQINTIMKVGEMTLMNTKIEVSMPGFMKIDYLNQIRKEEKIGGGGCAAIYKGVILDHLLRQVSFFFSFSLSFYDDKKLK